MTLAIRTPASLSVKENFPNKQSLGKPVLEIACTYMIKPIFVTALFAGVCVVAPFALAHLAYKIGSSKANWRKVASYTLSLYFCLFKNAAHLGSYTLYNEIDEKITLGALPYASRASFFKKHEVKHVLSLNESFELETSTLLTTPITKKQWEEMGINLCQKAAPDFLPVPLSTIDECVEFLHQVQDKVYVHCKAGVGRSATVVTAYYIKHKNMSAEEAIAFVKKQRPATHLNRKQLKQIFTYAAQLNRETQHLREKILDFKTFKEHLIQAVPGAKCSIERLPSAQLFDLLKQSVESIRGATVAAGA